MIENNSSSIILPKAETLTGLAQLSAFLVLVIPAYGFLVVSHYLANYGLQSVYVAKSQFFAAGFATIVAFLVAPACAALAMHLIFQPVKSFAHKCAFFAAIYAFTETLILKILYVSFLPNRMSYIWWIIVSILLCYAILTCWCSPPTTSFYLTIRRFAGPEKRFAVKGLTRWCQSLAGLAFSFILGFSILAKTDGTVATLVLSLTLANTSCFMPMLAYKKSSIERKRAQLLSIAAFIVINPFVFISIQGAIYGYLDSGWGGAGLNYVQIGLDEQSGMLAPCTWTMRLIEETESAYYVTFDHGGNYTAAYMVPKSKVSGIFFIQTAPPHVLDLAAYEKTAKSAIQVEDEKAVCSSLRALDASPTRFKTNY